MSSSELSITFIQRVGIYRRLYEHKLHLAFWSLDLLWVSAHMGELPGHGRTVLVLAAQLLLFL